ncbi:MAG: asparagine synthase-related protein [Promethearchaeati archaeon SRVP18_Atabeyarchaeia-1]
MPTCIVIGAFSKTGKSVSETVQGMLRISASDFSGIDNVKLALQDEYIEADSIEGFEAISLPPSTIALGIAYSSRDETPSSAAGDAESSFVAVTGRIFNQPDAPTALIQLLEKTMNATHDIELSSKKLVESLDGQYALALKWGNEFLLARDTIGVKPLYIAQDDHLIAFSSRRRPLWDIGLKNLKSVTQPTLISQGGVRTISSGMRIESIRLSERSAAQSLVTILSEVIAKMIAGHKEIGILFSGGLDSSVVAKLSMDLGVKCRLYCAGTRSSRDIYNARRMSSTLQIPLTEAEVTYENVAENLPRVVSLVESTDMIVVSTSLPIYFAIRESVNRGETLVLHGQGADELYGGYERYENTLAKEGYTAVCNEMLNDIVGLGNVIPQYDQLGTPSSSQILAPFLDASVVRFSLGIPIQLKLSSEGKRITRKYILRQVASRIGIRTELLPVQKVAVQFGSGVAKIMDLIARKAGFTKRLARESGFALPIQAYLEKIGGSLGVRSRARREKEAEKRD